MLFFEGKKVLKFFSEAVVAGFWSIIALQVGRSVDHFHKFKNDKSTAASKKRNNDIYYMYACKKICFFLIYECQRT